MKIQPVNNYVFVEPILHSELKTRALRKKASTILIPDLKPDNKTHDFEGVPSVGIIRYLPEGNDYGNLEIGMTIAFNEPNPKGFKLDDEKLFALKPEQIVAVISDEE